MNPILWYVLIIANCLICGVAAHFIANNRLMDHGFWWGFFLCEIGIVVVALRPNESPLTAAPSPEKISEELEKAFHLKNKGVLTEEEFNQMRENLLKKL